MIFFDDYDILGKGYLVKLKVAELGASSILVVLETKSLFNFVLLAAILC